MTNILKFIDDGNFKGSTVYIFNPTVIQEIHDTATGCRIVYLSGENFITGTSARQLKRSIQEELEQPIGYLKTAYTYRGHEGLRYVNVAHIISLTEASPIVKDGKTVETCQMVLDNEQFLKFYHSAGEIAYQVRRVLKRLDQDAEICCAPDEETEEE